MVRLPKRVYLEHPTTDWELAFPEAGARRRLRARSSQRHLGMARAALCPRSLSIFPIFAKVYRAGIVVVILPMAKDIDTLDSLLFTPQTDIVVICIGCFLIIYRWQCINLTSRPNSHNSGSSIVGPHKYEYVYLHVIIFCRYWPSQWAGLSMHRRWP